ncbi:MAG: DUF937 domain-containing protein, partial [Acidobacteriota bacterium]
TTQKAVAAALPMLLGTMARNANEPAGAAALAGALDRDHDGSVLDDVQGFLGGGAAENMGAGILRHVLGSRQGAAQRNLGQVGGLDSGKAAQLLAMMAPVVMGFLGQQKRQRQLGVNDLARELQQERADLQRQQPQVSGLWEQMIDRDGDGQIADDLAGVGMNLLGGLLGGRRR